MSVRRTYMSVRKCLFITLYKSVSYKAFFFHYIFLDSFFLKKKLDRKRKRKRLGAFFFLFPKTSPKRNDLSPALNLTTWRQTATKQQAGQPGKAARTGRGIQTRHQATRASGPPRPKRAPWKQTRKQNISPA